MLARENIKGRDVIQEKSMEEIKEKLKQIQEILIEDFKPLAIILFGSYSRNTQNPNSDIDIAFYAKNIEKIEIFKEKQKLEEILDKDIDLVNLANEDISDGFRYEILANGMVLYCTDPYKFDLYKLDMYREYLDLNESREGIINRIKEGGTIYGK